MIAEAVVGVLLLVGAGFALIGSVGLVRLPDFYTRLHGPTKATTLGVGSLLLASVVHFGINEGLTLHETIITLFLFMTAPVSAHVLAKAGLRSRVRSVTARPERTHGHPMEEDSDRPTTPGPRRPGDGLDPRTP